MNPDIQAAEPVKYLDQIVSLKIQMFKDAGYESLLAENAKEIIKADYERMYAAKTASHFIKLEGDEVIAMAGAFIKDDIPYRYYKEPRCGFIGDVYVTPSHRGQGLATKLSKSCIQWFKEKNVSMIRLKASGAGKPMYEKLGFEPTDEMVLNL